MGRVSIESDERDLAAVAGLAAMGGAAEGVEAVGLAVRILAERLDAAETAGGEAGQDEGLEIELVMTFPTTGSPA